jgi:hypothetical protein
VTLWLTLNSFAFVVLGAVTFLMLRQLGFVLQRSGPLAARGTNDGPRIGENIASHFAPAGIENGKAKLVVFMSESCGICGLVRTGAGELARAWHREAELFLIYDCADGEETRLEVLAQGMQMKKDASLRQRLGASFVPFALVTSAAGVVVSKGLVNDVAHLESLLEAEKVDRETGSLTVATDKKRQGELESTLSRT